MCKIPAFGCTIVISNFQLHAQLHLLPWLLCTWVQEGLQGIEHNICFFRRFYLVEEYLEHHHSRLKVGGILDKENKPLLHKCSFSFIIHYLLVHQLNSYSNFKGI